MDEGCPYVSCPQHKCDFILDDDKVLSLIDKEQVKLAYNRLVLNSYVEVCNHFDNNRSIIYAYQKNPISMSHYAIFKMNIIVMPEIG